MEKSVKMLLGAWRLALGAWRLALGAVGDSNGF